MSRAPDGLRERAAIRLQSAYRAYRIRRWAWQTAAACHNERWERLGFLGRWPFTFAWKYRTWPLRRIPPQ
eukprot:3277349-Alexandrium_andersonii.AAC.1